MLLLQHQILSPKTLQISYSKNFDGVFIKDGPTKRAKNMLVIFLEFPFNIHNDNENGAQVCQEIKVFPN